MGRRTSIAALAAAAALALAACGDSEEPATTAARTTPSPPASSGDVIAQLPPGADAPPAQDPDPEKGAAEASPEAPAEGPDTGDLEGVDEEAVTQAVRFYIAALDDHDGAGVCDQMAPGALRLSELPVQRGSCAASLDASIGHAPKGGGPAWRRTRIVAIKAVSVEGGGARVTATVTHQFSDRKYTSVEEDVIYLKQLGPRWVLAKPSGTLYRAVGYATPRSGPSSLPADLTGFAIRSRPRAAAPHESLRATPFAPK